jgi:hypothetical protein
MYNAINVVRKSRPRHGMATPFRQMDLDVRYEMDCRSCCVQDRSLCVLSSQKLIEF